MNPYLIQGPAAIGFSGGRSSAYMMQRIVEAHGGKLPADVHVGFQNTGEEHPLTLDFIKACDRHFGLGLVWMEFDRVWGQPDDAPHFKIVTYETASRNGEPFDKMMEYYRLYRKHEKDEGPILPSLRNRMCTAFLKTKTAAKWMRGMGYEEWDAIVGIRRDEPKRHKRMMEANEKRNERWTNVLPLWDAGVVQADVQEHWKAMPFDLGIHSDDGNCGGCFLIHQDKMLRRFRRDPSLADRWIDREQRTGQRFRIDRSDFKTMKFVAMEMNKQLGFTFPEPTPEEEDIADCICG